MELLVVEKPIEEAVNRAALCLLVAGCHRVFGVEGSTQPDAAGDATAADADCRAGHDEDNDGLPDLCDNCPGVANPDQNDTFEAMNGRMPDGVGDRCDPNPSLEGDRLASLVTFDEPNAIDRWRPADEWEITGGDLRVGSSSGVAQYIYDNVIPAPPYVVQLGFTLVSAFSNQHAYLELLADATTDDPPAAVFCGISRYGTSGTEHVIGGTDHVGLANSDDEPLPNGFEAGPHVVELRHEPGTGIRCAITPEGRATEVAQATLSQAPPPGAFGFTAFRVQARIHYVAIYRRD
ncbi:MAG: thrombospondin type 3 repeat-containing protein [Kofleriaceae bacterium]|nr:thrombospondin type 3 repeat-containing protein [Kofleriaceae bacterium]